MQEGIADAPPLPVVPAEPTVPAVPCVPAEPIVPAPPVVPAVPDVPADPVMPLLLPPHAWNTSAKSATAPSMPTV
jgi:hypothetical protein